MSKNEDHAMIIELVELTDQELSLVSGGFYPTISFPSAPDIVTQVQVNAPIQLALAVGGLGSIEQIQPSLQDQGVVIS